MIKTIDVLNMVVESATEKFSSKWSVNEDKYRKVEKICGLVDKINREFDCSAMEIDVVEDKADIVISVECIDIVMEDRDKHPFFDLIKQAKFFTINNLDGENMRLNFVLDGVWNII